MPVSFGSFSDDNIIATDGNDLIITFNGDDIVFAGDGNDLIIAGRGDDTVYAGAGDDRVFGGSGDDILHGEEGNDRVYGGSGDDTLSGGAGRNLLVGGSGFDTAEFAGSIFDYDINSGRRVTRIEQRDEAGDLISKDFLVGIEAMYFAAEDYTLYLDGRDNMVLFTGDDSGAVTEDEGAPATGKLTATDFDGDDGIVAVLSETASTGGYGTYTVDANGAWTYTLDDSNADVQALNDGEMLADTFDVVAEDGTVDTVSITINGADDGPAAPRIFMLNEGTEFEATDLVQDNFVYDFNAPSGDVSIQNFVVGEDRMIFTNMNGGAGFYWNFGSPTEVFVLEGDGAKGVGSVAGTSSLSTGAGGLLSLISFLDDAGAMEGSGFIEQLAQTVPPDPSFGGLRFESEALENLSDDNLFVVYGDDLILA